MYLSTEKPSKSTKGYTVTFHGNGLKFADGTDENMVVYNSSGQIVDGRYKEAVGTGVGWYSDEACKNRVMISDDGVPQAKLTGDLDLWAKERTFTLVSGSRFNDKIPNSATEVIFTDEVKPKGKEIIDVDADGDGGVVAWLDDDAGTVMKVSTQVPGVKVQTAADSNYMFYDRKKIEKTDLKMLDTSKAINMTGMFSGCSVLTNLDLTSLDTQNVTSMANMFKNCTSLTDLNITDLNASNVTNMDYMFAGCAKLARIDCSSMNAKKVTSAINMFCYCKNLSELKLPNFSEKLKRINQADRHAEVAGAWSVNGMFEECCKLTNLDLSPLNTSNVANMSHMFSGCSGLTSLDLTPLDAKNVTDMSGMFYGCSGLKSLSLMLNTQSVADMGAMFRDCSSLTILDLSPLDTQNVTDMGLMFYGCSGLKSLDLTPLSTQNVTDMNSMFSS